MTVLTDMHIGTAVRAFLAPTDVSREGQFFIARKAMQSRQDYTPTI